MPRGDLAASMSHYYMMPDQLCFRKRLPLPGIYLLLILLTSCQKTEQQAETANRQAPTTIVSSDSGYQLLHYGKPYFIKGAGGISHLEELAACGGNSIRVWDDIDAGRILDEAHTLGITVMLGLWVEREMEGFDYDDRAAVERQYNRIRKTILRYRNHPALLMWCVGNEWAQDADNFKVFDEVNRLARLVHELDPGHPTSTAISPDSKRAIWLVSQRCTEVDILAVNSYGLTARLDEFFRGGGWTKPYLISEYGAPAYWEVPTAPWGAPDEPTSQQKVDFVRQFYRQYIASKPLNCLGAYLFYWGSKQEETSTWFSIFDEQRRQTPLVGLMQELWRGTKPTNRAPVIQQLLIDGEAVAHRSFAVSDTVHWAAIRVTEPERDSLRYEWVMKRRARSGSDYVGIPRPAIQGLITRSDKAIIQFRLPQNPGAYRLFVNVFDTHEHVATANFSFLVTAPQSRQ